MIVPHFGLDRQYKTLREELLSATDKVLSSGRLINGKHTDELEEWLKRRCGTKYAITVHSGTQALEIIATYLRTNVYANFTPKIRIPNITYPATLNAFINAGYEVSLGDTDKNGLLDFKEEETEYYTSMCFVGLYGASPREHLLGPLAIVDGAQHWLSADGNIGLGMAISFDPTKNLPASGNGGAIVTNNENLYWFAHDYKNNGKMRGHRHSGTNSKMSEIDCAHVMVRAQYVADWQKRRKEIRNKYIELLKDSPVRCLSEGFKYHADQKFVIATSDRDELQKHLSLNGIESVIHYKNCLSELPITRNFNKPDIISTSSMLTRMVLSLPIYPELTDGEVEYVADKVLEFFDK